MNASQKTAIFRQQNCFSSGGFDCKVIHLVYPPEKVDTCLDNQVFEKRKEKKKPF